MIVSGDPYRAEWLFTKRAQCGQLRLDLFDPLCNSLQQALAGLGGGDAACRPCQQAKPEPACEATNRLAQRGLGHSEAGCGPSEAARPGDGDEGSDVIEGCARH